MKRLLSAAIITLMLLSFLCSCTDSKDQSSVPAGPGGEAAASTADPDAVVRSLISEYSLKASTIYSSVSDKEEEKIDDSAIRTLYGTMFESPDFSMFESFCIFLDHSDTNRKSEIAVFKVKDTASIQETEAFIASRAANEISQAVNYPSRDVSSYKEIKTGNINNYVYYVAVFDNRVEITESLVAAINSNKQ